jgi:RNA polymerase sigma-70 factor (ECF subfamily)
MISFFFGQFRYPINGILPAFVSYHRARELIGFMESEKTLLAGLRDLDPQVISKIHEIYFPSVYRYAHYRTGDEEVAEDLASEAFIRLLEAVHAGRGPNTSLRGWLMGTISNLVNDYYRKVYNKPSHPLYEGLEAPNGNPESLSEKRTQHKILRWGLSKLTPDQQHVLALRFGSSCSLEETADVMGKKPNAIKQLQFRALAALRKHVEGEI